MTKARPRQKKAATEAKTQKGLVIQIALGLLMVAGTLTIIALAPGIGAALKMLDPNPRKAMDKLERGLRRLSQSGDLEVEGTGKNSRYRITPTGAQRLARLRFAEYTYPPHTKKWDGKWRLVCFDIPETEQYVRKLFQSKLSDIGFYRLQNSVFVFPYECSELINLADQAFDLEKYVRVALVERIDNEQHLLNFFCLKR